MSRYLAVLSVVVVLATCVGCASFGVMPTENVTQVELSSKNYEIVQTNAVGTDFGVKLFGFIPINPTSLAEAMESLHEDAKTRPGDCRALINVAKEYRCLYLILFSVPRIVVRADVIEFKEVK